MRLVAIFFAIFLAGCEKPAPQAIEKSDELVILARLGVTTYSVDNAGGAGGFEYDLASRFAEDQGLKSRLVVADNDTDLLNRLARGEGHMAIAWAAPTEESGIRSSASYARSQDVIVTHEASLPIATVRQLANRTIHVIAGSRQEKKLLDVARRVPGLTITPSRGGSELDLMEGVAEHRFEATVVSDAAFDIGSNFYPELQDSLEIGSAEAVVWLFSPSVSPEFIAKANDFLDRAQKSGEIDRLKDRYFRSC